MNDPSAYGFSNEHTDIAKSEVRDFLPDSLMRQNSNDQLVRLPVLMPSDAAEMAFVDHTLHQMRKYADEATPMNFVHLNNLSMGAPVPSQAMSQGPFDTPGVAIGTHYSPKHETIQGSGSRVPDQRFGAAKDLLPSNIAASIVQPTSSASLNAFEFTSNLAPSPTGGAKLLADAILATDTTALAMLLPSITPLQFPNDPNVQTKPYQSPQLLQQQQHQYPQQQHLRVSEQIQQQLQQQLQQQQLQQQQQQQQQQQNALWQQQTRVAQGTRVSMVNQNGEHDNLPRSGSSFSGMVGTNLNGSISSENVIKLEGLPNPEQMHMHLQNIQALDNQLHHFYGLQHPQHQAPTLHFFGGGQGLQGLQALPYHQQSVTSSNVTQSMIPPNTAQEVGLSPSFQSSQQIESPKSAFVKDRNTSGSVHRSGGTEISYTQSPSQKVPPIVTSPAQQVISPSMSIVSSNTVFSHVSNSPSSPYYNYQANPYSSNSYAKPVALLHPNQQIAIPQYLASEATLASTLDRYVKVPLSGFAEAPASRELASVVGHENNTSVTEPTSTATVSPAEAGFNPNAIPFPVVHQSAQLRPGRGRGLKGTKEEVNKLRLARKAERARLTRLKRKAYASQLQHKAVQLRAQLARLEQRERTAAERKERAAYNAKHVVAQISMELTQLWKNSCEQNALKLSENDSLNSDWSSKADRSEIEQVVQDTMMMMMMMMPSNNSEKSSQPKFVPSVELGFHVLRRMYAASGLNYIPDGSAEKSHQNTSRSEQATRSVDADLTRIRWLRSRRMLEGGSWRYDETAAYESDDEGYDSRSYTHSRQPSSPSMSAKSVSVKSSVVRSAVAGIPPPRLQQNTDFDIAVEAPINRYQPLDNASHSGMGREYGDNDFGSSIMLTRASSRSSGPEARYTIDSQSEFEASDWGESGTEFDTQSVVSCATSNSSIYGPSRMTFAGNEPNDVGNSPQSRTGISSPPMQGYTSYNRSQDLSTRYSGPASSKSICSSGGASNPTVSPNLTAYYANTNYDEDPSIAPPITGTPIHSSSRFKHLPPPPRLKGTVQSPQIRPAFQGSPLASPTNSPQHQITAGLGQFAINSSPQHRLGAAPPVDEGHVDEDTASTSTRRRTRDNGSSSKVSSSKAGPANAITTASGRKSTKGRESVASAEADEDNEELGENEQLGYAEGLKSGVLQAKDIDLTRLNVDELPDDQVAKLVRQLSYSAEGVRANAWRAVKRLEKSLDLGQSAKLLFFLASFDLDAQNRTELATTAAAASAASANSSSSSMHVVDRENGQLGSGFGQNQGGSLVSSATFSPAMFTGLNDSRSTGDNELSLNSGGRLQAGDGEDPNYPLDASAPGSSVHLPLLASLVQELKVLAPMAFGALQKLQDDPVVATVTSSLRSWNRTQKELAKNILQVRDYFHQLDTLFAAIRAIFGQRGLLKLHITLARQPQYAALVKQYMDGVFNLST